MPTRVPEYVFISRQKSSRPTSVVLVLLLVPRHCPAPQTAGARRHRFKLPAAARDEVRWRHHRAGLDWTDH
eukprot:861733-Rhodomonas_salina.1